MKFRKILSLVLLLSLSTVMAGRPATRRTVTLTQPDGSTVAVQLHGDEFHHWMTADGVEVVVGEDGFIVPARVSGAARAAAMKRAAESRAQRQRSYSPRLRSGDGVHSLVILVEFSDVKFQSAHTFQAFYDMLNLPGYNDNGAIGSAFDYFSDNSGGRFDVTFDVLGPVTLTRPMAYYGSDGDKRSVLALIEACQQLDSSVDFTQYDSDGDDVVDNVFFFYAGYNEADGGPADSIWPYAFDVPSAVGNLKDEIKENINYTFDGKTLGAYACTSELFGNTGSTMAGIGTFCHEFGHVLGLPDMYDTDTREGIDMVCFSLMAVGCDNDNGRRPPYLTAVEKEILGWGGTQTLLTEPREYTLVAVQNNVAYILPTDTPDEYFVLECRTDEKWDSGLGMRSSENPDLVAGLLIYHVDKSESHYPSGTNVSAGFIWRHLDSYNILNADPDHPLCYVVASSPDYSAESEGPAAKYLFPGDAGQTAFSAETDPAAKGWSGNFTNHYLSDIAYSTSDMSVSFRYYSLDGLGQKGFCAISNPGAGRYSAGSSFDLSLTDSIRTPAQVKWYFDGQECQSSTITLPSGTHTITAVLTFSSGSPELLEQVICVE